MHNPAGGTIMCDPVPPYDLMWPGCLVGQAQGLECLRIGRKFMLFEESMGCWKSVTGWECVTGWKCVTGNSCDRLWVWPVANVTAWRQRFTPEKVWPVEVVTAWECDRSTCSLADHTFTVSALWWHQKAFTCNSRPRFQLLGNVVQTEGEQEEATKINHLTCL